MRVFKSNAETSVTCWTMKEILSAMNSANSTLVTVKLLPILIIKKATDGTKVSTKLNPTQRTIAIHRLTCTTQQTDNLTDSMSVDLVCFTTIMTEPTWVDFVAARRHIQTSTPVMSTGIFFLFKGRFTGKCCLMYW